MDGTLDLFFDTLNNVPPSPTQYLCRLLENQLGLPSLCASAQSRLILQRKEGLLGHCRCLMSSHELTQQGVFIGRHRQPPMRIIPNDPNGDLVAGTHLCMVYGVDNGYTRQMTLQMKGPASNHASCSSWELDRTWWSFRAAVRDRLRHLGKGVLGFSLEL